MKALYITNKNRTQYQINRFKRYLSRYTLAEISLTSTGLLVAAWFTLSFFDVIFNNLSNYTYAKWNLIIILSNLF